MSRTSVHSQCNMKCQKIFDVARHTTGCKTQTPAAGAVSFAACALRAPLFHSSAADKFPVVLAAPTCNAPPPSFIQPKLNYSWHELASMHAVPLVHANAQEAVCWAVLARDPAAARLWSLRQAARGMHVLLVMQWTWCTSDLSSCPILASFHSSLQHDTCCYK